MLIAHASADLADKDIGFVHAAALAAAHGGERKLVTLHVPTGAAPAQPPDVKNWLRRWRLPDDHIEQSLFTSQRYDDPVDGLLEGCRATRPDLLVLPTHARGGLSRVLSGSIAQAVARNVSIPTLLLPLDGRRFVDEETGTLDLRRVLVLGGSKADAQLGVDAASWITREVKQGDARVTMLHVFDNAPFPQTSEPPDIRLHVQHRDGELIDTVVMVCAELQPQLIVMVSHGHDQLRDVLVANRTERVLRAGHRPLLWVPPAFAPRQQTRDRSESHSRERNQTAR